MPQPDVLVATGRTIEIVAHEAIVKINPVTGLTTDFTNVFNEIIMLLEMLPDWPEALDEVADWEDFSYESHFQMSGYVDKALIIEAFRLADPAIRQQLNDLILDANTLLATQLAAICAEPADSLDAAAKLADELRQQVDYMTALVNGPGSTAEQHGIDELFEGDANLSAADIDALFD